ncbi:MAG TPA: hypothetical protein VJ836_07995 [Candidatus Saccharimonadales bacterium]|nr:hypothetical protein [Candidatus Saccharimonadales bacterium]
MSNHVFDLEKWARLSLFEQMGNIGSEVGRAMNAMQRGDITALQGAYYRGLDLIDATAPNLSTISRRRELLRARELFSESVELGKVDKSLDTYFMQYAIAARASR